MRQDHCPTKTAAPARHLIRRAVLGFTTAAFLLLLVIVGQQQGHPSDAVPLFARRYQVSCATCHTVAPRLNRFGMAFQANNFNWPGVPQNDNQGLSAFPISGIATFSAVNDAAEGTNASDYRNLALYSSDGFSFHGLPNGGYFVRMFAATKTDDARPGDFDSAFAALPVSGRHGQWALLGGQMAPMNYSWDDHNDMTDSMPMALDTMDGFSLENPMPGFRLDYDSGRGNRTPDGNYLSVGVPFGGLLALNSEGRWGSALGVFAQAFHRHGDNTLGAFGYGGSGESLAGLISSQYLSPNLYLWEAGSLARDPQGDSTRNLSVQMTYTPRSDFGVVGRLEAMGGSQDAVYPVFGVTYYPGRQQVLRLAAETVQQPGSRTNTVFAYVQF